ncbi:MAG: hypothetical protein WCL21_10265 [Mariniphaga sp.]
MSDSEGIEEVSPFLSFKTFPASRRRASASLNLALPVFIYEIMLSI